MKFGSKKAIFGVIWGGFEGFGPCLGISHPTHPHLGEISQKNFFFFFLGGGGSPNTSYGISLLFGVWHLQSGGSVGSSKKSGPNEKWGGVCLELIN